MPGITRTMTQDEVETIGYVSPSINIVAGELYWLSSFRKPREFSPSPIRARLAQQAARAAVRWTGESVLLWSHDPDGGEIVWVEWPAETMQSTGRKMGQFVYAP